MSCLNQRKTNWGCSSVGRAPALHAGGREFESPQLHHDIMRDIQDLGEHILLFRGFFDENYCRNCIEVFDKCEKLGITNDRGDIPSLAMKDQAIGIVELSGSAMPFTKQLTDVINHEIIPEFFKKYPIENNYQYIGLGGAKMQKTRPTEGYHVWHMEHCNQIDSKNTLLAWGLFLNDIEEGGELEFLYQSKRIKPQTGDFVLWPAGFTHMHRGNPPLSGNKYIFTGWIDYI